MRIIASVFVLLVSAFVLGGLAFAQVADGNYVLIAAHSDKCLDVSGVSTDDFATVYQWDCHGGDNQTWRITHQGNGVYQIKAMHSGKCLDVSGASTDNFADLHQYTCHADENQQFRITPQNAGFQIQAVHSNQCLDISGVSVDNGANLHQYNCVGSSNQTFLLRPVSPSATNATGFPLITSATNLVLHVDQIDDFLIIKVNGVEVRKVDLIHHGGQAVDVELTQYLTNQSNLVEFIAENGPGSATFLASLRNNGNVVKEWSFMPQHVGQVTFIHDSFEVSK